MDESLSVGTLIASIEVAEMSPVVAAIRTLADTDVKWESVAECLFDEWRGLKKTVQTGETGAAATVPCNYFSRPGNRAETCWIHPASPNNRLDRLKGGSKNRSGNIFADGKRPADKPKREKKKGGERAAMPRTGPKTARNPDYLMVDSGTTSHMTARSDCVSNQTGCGVDIQLADHSTVTATKTGIRTVVWQSHAGPTRVSLSNTLVAQSIKTILLSVPALVKKDIAVLFVPGKALFIDLPNDNTVLRYAQQRADGLFYVSDQQD